MGVGLQSYFLVALLGPISGYMLSTLSGYREGQKDFVYASDKAFAKLKSELQMSVINSCSYVLF